MFNIMFIYPLNINNNRRCRIVFTSKYLFYISTHNLKGIFFNYCNGYNFHKVSNVFIKINIIFLEKIM